MLTRRTFIETAAFGALLAKTGTALAAEGGADEALTAMLRRHAEGLLLRSPEEATNAGFDTGSHAALRGMLDDRSLAGRARDRAAVAAARVELETRIDRDALSPRAALDYDIAHFTYENLAFGLGSYGYMDLNLRPSPYVVSQMNGAYYWLPDFIGSRHPLEDAADVDAWLSRLSGLATVLDQETQRIRHDAAQGVVPPGFVIDRTLPQIEQLRDASVLDSNLTAPAIRRASDAGLGDLQDRAARIMSREVACAAAPDRRAVGAAGGRHRYWRRLAPAGGGPLLCRRSPVEHHLRHRARRPPQGGVGTVRRADRTHRHAAARTGHERGAGRCADRRA